MSAATASAEVVYIDGQVVGAPPAYVYESAPAYPAPYYRAAPVVRAAPAYVEPGYEVVRPRGAVVNERPRSYIVEPAWTARSPVAPMVRYESRDPWISVNANRSCEVDPNGFERCY